MSHQPWAGLPGSPVYPPQSTTAKEQQINNKQMPTTYDHNTHRKPQNKIAKQEIKNKVLYKLWKVWVLHDKIICIPKFRFFCVHMACFFSFHTLLPLWWAVLPQWMILRTDVDILFGHLTSLFSTKFTTYSQLFVVSGGLVGRWL